MPYYDYEYDPTAELVDNFITQEEHTVTTSRGIFPTHGAFYQKDLLVEGFTTGGEWVELNLNEHFVFSPMFVPISMSTGKFAYSYIVIIVPLTDFGKIRLTYRAVGKYSDTKLDAYLINNQFDRSKLYKWTTINAFWESYNSTTNTTVETREGLAALANAIGVLAAAIDKLNPPMDIDVATRLSVLENQI